MIYICESILSNGVSLVQLGEEQFGQEGINFGFTLDGTKDSAKFEVFSYRKESIKPFSVVCHSETSSWWIVSKDKVERYTNEQGWIYKHSLQCVGAIELLNARDLTNCAFNQGKYTLSEFILRLFQLSNFEFKTPNIITNGNIDINQVVDYIKTFENYTLLSALRELLDGYNQCVKLEFTRNLTYNQITGCNLVITPKTGDISLQVLDIDNDFNNVQEQRNMDKSSYGTIVVSNVDNAVSSETKVYPNVGGAKLMSTEYNTTPDNALIKLQSNAFYVQSVDMCLTIELEVVYVVGGTMTSYIRVAKLHNVANGTRDMLLEAKETILNNSELSRDFDDVAFDNMLDELEIKLYNSATVRFQQGVIYDPTNTTFYYKDNSYQVKSLFLQHIPSTPIIVPTYYVGQVVLCDKETAQGTHNPWNCLQWNRGSDEISGFGWISDDKYSRAGNYQTIGFYGGGCYVPADQTIDGNDSCVLFQWDSNNGTFNTSATLTIKYQRVEARISETQTTGDKNCIKANNFSTDYEDNPPRQALFKVKYIPMTDLKIKLDNNEENNHTHLYNQNGKLTDTLAFSKLINSYKEEIETENVVKYHNGYELFELGTSTFKTISLPKLGQIVLDSDNEQYIINSVSYNLYQNEPNQYSDDNDTYTQYYIECEYNLSKYVATKSLMVNPNTNIRDYGIPQKYNTKRTHLLRDFVEFGYELEHSDIFVQPLDNVLNITNRPQQYAQHSAVMKIEYSHLVNGSNKYYYQLESTTYMLKKAIYECVEFKDNNIIGYDCQNVWSGFDIRKIFTGFGSYVSTPISYTDENGNFTGIYICMCNSEQLNDIYDMYIDENSLTTDLPIQDMIIFIPVEIYEYANTLDKCDYRMDYSNYNKDALEVPVFEYCCQLDDSRNVVVGENILVNNENDILYFYEYKLVTKGVVNNNNWTSLSLSPIGISQSSGNWTIVMNNVVSMNYSTNVLGFALYGSNLYSSQTDQLTFNDRVNINNIDLANHDLAIIRRTIRYVNTNARIEDIVNTGHIDPQEFVFVDYDYQYSEYINIDITDKNPNSIYVIRTIVNTTIEHLFVSVSYDSVNHRLSVLASCQQQPLATDTLDIAIEYSYETTSGSYANTNNDLMFVIRHTEEIDTDSNFIYLYANNWKLD